MPNEVFQRPDTLGVDVTAPKGHVDPQRQFAGIGIPQL